MANGEKDIDNSLEDFISAAQLQKNWGLNVLNAKQVRAVVKIETSKGTYALKKVNFTPEKLNFIYEAQEYLWEKGYQHQSRWLPASNGQPYVKSADGSYYYINQWINGKESDVKDSEQLKTMMEMQANFHLSSLGFTPSSKAKVPAMWEQGIKDYEFIVKELKSFYADIKQQPLSKFESAFFQTAEPMTNMAEEGLALLKQSSYEKAMNRAMAEKGLVHGDFAYHNFIKATDGDLYVIDFDLCAQNLRILDLAYFIRKVMDRAKWDINLTYTILEEYHKINPITEDELQILKAMLHLPKRYYKYVKQGLELEQFRNSDTIKQMEKEAAKLSKRIKFLNEFPRKL
ncbi:CotS family spore coat protein [Bacillus sp. M6-12]|uniref:CotS family spore coat protein n=1 Tax=Bacillus sp. M6-12 TaxID=2054166 RepID=UPI0015E15629|nr:CotS family spore coat protein [Bacillus sp. M6-12]